MSDKFKAGDIAELNYAPANSLSGTRVRITGRHLNTFGVAEGWSWEFVDQHNYPGANNWDYEESLKKVEQPATIINSGEWIEINDSTQADVLKRYADELNIEFSERTFFRVKGSK